MLLNKKQLMGMTLSDIVLFVTELNLPKYTAKQIADWIYVKRARSIDEMTNISFKNRELLNSVSEVGCSSPIDIQVSLDGTKKMLFQTSVSKMIETVTIPEDDRLTICVSSQIGCKMKCAFCMTGRMGFHGNLSVNDILNQIYSVPNSENITNVVFMGMGEPLDNYENVMKSIEILTSDYSLAWSPRRITLSTIGLEDKLYDFLNNSRCHLAVSLHNPFSKERLNIMPIERRYPVEQIIEKFKKLNWDRQRKLSFEYIMFKGVNDSLLYARELVKLLSGLYCRVNLIRFHVIPDSSLLPSDEDTMVKFRDFLTSKGLISTIRSSRGEDIFAACGMLSTSK